MMLAQRADRQIIKPSNRFYPMLHEYCHLAKNLYNHANFLVRQELFNSKGLIRYTKMDSLLKADKEYPDYAAMPTAQAAQQVLRQLDKDWKSFSKAKKDWKQHPDKYKGIPRIPRYKKKDGCCTLVMTNQNAKLKDGGIITFPKTFKGFTAQSANFEKENFYKFNQVRFLPRTGHIIMEIVYTIEVPNALSDNGRYCSVDIGVDNLAAVTNNAGLPAFVINGKGLKSVNKRYNQLLGHYQSIAKQINKQDYTKRMAKLTNKRLARINDYLHKASHYIVKFAAENAINTIVVGKNDGWKQDVDMGKVNNQTFVQIPFARLIQMLQYKAENAGISVITHEEAFTSGTSFLDGEIPCRVLYDKTRRIKRGLFRSNNGILINADLNGSYQIMKKVFPKAFSEGIAGVALHPMRVNMA